MMHERLRGTMEVEKKAAIYVDNLLDLPGQIIRSGLPHQLIVLELNTCYLVSYPHLRSNQRNIRSLNISVSSPSA
jgi:hypothetical protein